MGASSSKTLFEHPPPEQLSEFKKLIIAPEEYCIPEIQEKRQLTDKYFVYVYGVVAFVLIILISYTLYHGDSRRYTNGYDMCGNICGVKNDYVEGIDCSGKDMQEFRYLQYESNILKELDNNDDFSSVIVRARRQCVKECNPALYDIDNNRCLPIDRSNTNNGSIINPTLKEYNDIFGALGNIILITLIGVGLCIIMPVLFRYATAFIIWFIVVGGYLFMIIVTFLLWVATGINEEWTMVAIGWSIVSVIATVVMIAVFKRIPLLISVFKEAMKAIWAMPLIIYAPLLTFLSLFITLLLCIILTFNMLLCGVLVIADMDIYDYELTNTMSFTIIFNLIFTIWTMKFISGCQTMVVSGCISTWYFSRDKIFLKSPIKDSFKNLIKFHLGSVILGSLILTAVTVFKALVRALMNNQRTRILVSWCISLMEKLLVYITKNAYIMIAMHGEDFFKSGKRAVKLIFLNFNDMFALTSIGDLVVLLAEMLIINLTILLSFWIHEATIENYWLVIIVGAIICSLLAHSIFKTVEIAIDTIFLCYCEDCCINDGISRPYYMSTELMQFFHESKAALIPV